MTNGSESLMAVVDGKIVDIRVPYPMGFFTKLADGRIDDPKAGWKGRPVDHVGHAHRVPQRRRHGEQPEGIQVQVPDP